MVILYPFIYYSNKWQDGDYYTEAHCEAVVLFGVIIQWLLPHNIQISNDHKDIQRAYTVLLLLHQGVYNIYQIPAYNNLINTLG